MRSCAPLINCFLQDIYDTNKATFGPYGPNPRRLAAAGEVPGVHELVGVGAERLEEEGRLADDSDAGHVLLDGEADDGDHREAAVLELLGLHGEPVGGGGGVQAEGIETEVAGYVVLGAVLALDAVQVDRGGEAAEKGEEKEGRGEKEKRKNVRRERRTVKKATRTSSSRSPNPAPPPTPPPSKTHRQNPQ